MEPEAAKSNCLIGKRKVILCGVACALSAMIVVCVMWGPAIFQRGNPFPYLTAALTLSQEKPYAQVCTDTTSTTFLTQSSVCPELIRHIEDKCNASFHEQGGSAFLFSSNGKQLVVNTEILWGNYIVWDVPCTGAP